MKLCIKCNIQKDVLEFYRKTSAKDGYSSYCKICHKNYDQSDVAKNVRKQYLTTKKADVCHQKRIRDKTLKKDLSLGLPLNPPISEFVLSQEKLTEEHRKFIHKYEWLRSIGFGVRYVFTARYKGILGGVVMIAEPNGYQFSKELEALIQRGACAGWTPINLGSKLVMFSCNWMVKNTSKRIFTAYSDPDAGEIGTIYQACNFDYLGKKFGTSEMFVIGKKKVGTRHFTRTSSMKKWAKQLKIQWQKDWTKSNGFQDVKAIPEDIKKQLNDYAKQEMKKYKKVKVKSKGKYVLLLNYGKNKIKKSWISLAYPKREVYTEIKNKEPLVTKDTPNIQTSSPWSVSG